MRFRGIIGLMTLLIFHKIVSGQTAQFLSPEIKAALQTEEGLWSPISISWRESSFNPELRGPPGTESKLNWDRSAYTLNWQDGSIYLGTRMFQSMDVASGYSDGEESSDSTTVYIGDVGKNGLVMQKPALNDGAFPLHLLEDVGFDLPTLKNAKFQSEILMSIKKGQLLRTEEEVVDGSKLSRIDVRVSSSIRQDAIDTNLVKFADNLRRQGASKVGIDRKIAEVYALRSLTPFLVERFYLNREIGYALVRHEVTSETGQLVEVVQNSDFVRVQQRLLWVPRKTEHRHIWFATDKFPETSFGHNIEVLAINGDPIPKDKFVLNYTSPGTHIRDETGDGTAKEYIVPLNQVQLERATTEASKEINSQAGTQESHVWVWIMASVASFIAAMVVLLVAWHRRKLKAP